MTPVRSPQGLGTDRPVCTTMPTSARTRSARGTPTKAPRLPLTAFWVEDEVIIGERHVFSHAFYELPGGCARVFQLCRS
jgi:hypothetical protein